MSRLRNFSVALTLVSSLALLDVRVSQQRIASAATIQQKLEGPVNYWLTGNPATPAVQQIVSYAVSGSYAYVNWTLASGNAGGQMLLQNSAGTWTGVFSSGGSFSSTELVARGLPQATAHFFTTASNFVTARVNAPSGSQTPR